VTYFDTENNRKSQDIYENFVWNEPIAAELFSLEAPQGFKLANEIAGDSPLPPFIQMLENIKKATSVTFLGVRSDRAPADRETKWYLIDGFERIETADQKRVSVTDYKQKSMVRLDSEKKTAQVRQLTDPQAAVSPIEDLLKLTENDAELIETTDLNGKPVRVYRLKRIEFPRFGLTAKKAVGAKQKNVQAKVWVDTETSLPVRIVLESISVDNQVEQSVVLEKFTWNEKLDPKLFTLDIPAGFNVLKTKP
jgi:outer membrane lipoprotein-sorting protein